MFKLAWYYPYIPLFFDHWLAENPGAIIRWPLPSVIVPMPRPEQVW